MEGSGIREHRQLRAKLALGFSRGNTGHDVCKQSRTHRTGGEGSRDRGTERGRTTKLVDSSCENTRIYPTGRAYQTVKQTPLCLRIIAKSLLFQWSRGAGMGEKRNLSACQISAPLLPLPHFFHAKLYNPVRVICLTIDRSFVSSLSLCRGSKHRSTIS